MFNVDDTTILRNPQADYRVSCNSKFGYGQAYILSVNRWEYI